MKRTLLASGLLLVLLGAAAGIAWPLTGRTLLERAIPSAAAQDRVAVAAARVRPILEAQLAARQLRYGDPIFIRIFKHERRLELWVRQADGEFVLFRNYGICTYSGALGPKVRQGDLQAPEGFYRVRLGQLNPASAYHLSFNLGYPNAYDRAWGRTGDFLMVHGSCVSIGCYAMGDDNIEEIYTLVEAALRGGQREVPVHIFPFDFSAPPQADWRSSQPWGEFWGNLQEGFDAFAQSKRPPTITVSGRRYVVAAVPATN
jgi:murein L,D-transpeptidase YafK